MPKQPLWQWLRRAGQLGSIPPPVEQDWSIRPLPTGDTRPGDLRYNILVRLGNLGCWHAHVRDWDTEEIYAHWRNHLDGIYDWQIR